MSLFVCLFTLLSIVKICMKQHKMNAAQIVSNLLMIVNLKSDKSVNLVSPFKILKVFLTAEYISFPW